jgi:hypothetical protein
MHWRKSPTGGLPDNLDEFPPKKHRGPIEITTGQYPNLAFTGTNVDPQLYRHEEELIGYLRERLTGDTRLSLHTTGFLPSTT